MGNISYKRFEKLIEKHERYIKGNTSDWKSCKAVVISEKIGKMIIRDAYLPFSSFEFATFNETTFIKANFEHANFSKCNFHNCNFISCRFSNATFTDTKFDGCLFTGSRLNFCTFDDCSISDSKAMSDDVLEALDIDKYTYLNSLSESLQDVNIIGSIFKGCAFSKAFAEEIYFIRNFVNGCHFYECDFSLVDIYGDKTYRDNRSVFNNCDFDIDSTNIPDLPMACPRAGSFIAYKKVKVNPNTFWGTINIGSYAIVVLKVPASAKRSSANNKKCRCDKAKVLRFETLDGEKIKDTKRYTFVSMHDSCFEYTVGKTVAPEKPFCEDRWKECSSGIHFFMDREDAVFY